MADSPLQHKYKILAGTNNHEDLLSAVELLADSVADVRTKLPGVQPEHDTVAMRMAAAAVLKDMVDTVRRIRKNSMQRPSDSSEDSV